MVYKIIISCLCLSLICSSCSKFGVCDNVEYNDTFEIEEDGRYCFSDGSELTIIAFRNEFCPCNSDCFWAGQMVEEMEYFSAGILGVNTLPNGSLISGIDDDIEFVKACSISDPSPDIVKAKISVSN